MEQLRRMREEAGFSQSRLARESGVDRATINKVEMGRRSPSIETLEKLTAAMGREMGDLFPKAQASLPFETSGERRNPYEPWLQFINSYADRWESKIAKGEFDLGAVWEFARTVEDLMEPMGELGIQEKREQPAGYIYTHGPVMGEAINRLTELFTPLMEASVKQFEASELSRLRRTREGLTAMRDTA